MIKYRWTDWDSDYEDQFVDLGDGVGFWIMPCGCTVWCIQTVFGWLRDQDGHQTICSGHVNLAIWKTYGMGNWSRL